MNKLKALFKDKTKKRLSVYFTAGYPSLSDTVRILEGLQESGVDFAEIGFPYSDPLADGPVIQECHKASLRNGMTLELLFSQLRDARHLAIPKVLMGYLNPVLQMGIEKFIDRCRECEIDALIIPDLPFDFYERYFSAPMNEAGLLSVFLTSPSTKPERMEIIRQHTTGFVYITSDHGITGSSVNFEKQKKYFQKVREFFPGIPKFVGFGIQTGEQYNLACRYAEGAIVGSAFLKHIMEFGTHSTSIKKFINQFRYDPGSN
ncbi:MAG: tryptophan synthase subunit alpha [Bacteroidia bacterium]|nr:tryptophan synthase subunit alpha [Bacteroidia bacterium]